MNHPIVIVGAGIVGASIAWNLARRGKPVLILDQTGIGRGATARSFGWINANFAETPAYFSLRSAAIDAHHEMEAALGPVATRWCGCLWWEDEGAAFDAHAAELAAFGYAAQVVAKPEIVRMAPVLARPPERAIHVAREGGADGEVIAARLTEAAVALGAKVWIGPKVTGLLRKNGRVSGAATDHGAVLASQVIIAAGAGAEKLTGLPMANKPGLILRTRPLSPFLGPIIMAPDVHFRQDAEGRIVAGEIFSGDGPGQANITTDPGALADALIQRIQAHLPGQKIEIERVTLGQRPVPKDGLPAVGPMEEGLYLAAMHSGITLAPLIGALVAQEIAEGRHSPELAPFRPTRFSPRPENILGG